MRRVSGHADQSARRRRLRGVLGQRARARPALQEHFAGSHAVSCAAAIDAYEGGLRDIIHALKYDGRRSIAPPLGALMRRARRRAAARTRTCVVPVPLHPRRERSRGFNQADDLASISGCRFGRCSERIVHTHSQIELPKDERQRMCAMRLRWNDRRHVAPDLQVARRRGAGRRRVDDRSDAGACASVLKRSGVREVRALTAARVASARR